MSLNLPPLASLPAFEAAGRLLSFTRAAEELNVTQAAVSFQVRSLESSLGLRLFDRRHRMLALTPEGEVLHRAVKQGLTTISLAKALVCRESDDFSLVITAPLSLTSRWLAQRVARFQAENPDTRLKILADDTALNLETGGIDIALRYLTLDDPRAKDAPYLEDTVFPVCSPEFQASLVDGLGGDRTDIDVPLFSDQMGDVTWSSIAKSVGVSDRAVATAASFSHSVNVIDAAISGSGLALGRLPLVADDLASGRLVRPFDGHFRSAWGYFLFVSPASEGRPQVQAAVSWLLVAARETMATEPARSSGSAISV